ncbi:uncharacterized protein BT62DRAFT_924742 [Guyanagaster necrorhizus]|uniref:Uncharacterized protein n=1 Tax=Guyanagaster necrorhizus TaxID=856835 RepID=A0A9P7VFG2_9AGAR|nr:uncharacterized protein BT62DRAFT_924742 [Guyanagaster necrorhizus MCA 3950]KAG7439425.1 hypothetical protein BT62DRAFT_924742 [Guyanagaster necrorhizus MCA 3950]
MSDEYGGGGKRQQHSYGFFRFRGTGVWILNQPSSHVFAVDGRTPFGLYEIMVTLYVLDIGTNARTRMNALKASSNTGNIRADVEIQIFASNKTSVLLSFIGVLDVYDSSAFDMARSSHGWHTAVLHAWRSSQASVCPARHWIARNSRGMGWMVPRMIHRPQVIVTKGRTMQWHRRQSSHLDRTYGPISLMKTVIKWSRLKLERLEPSAQPLRKKFKSNGELMVH